MNLIQPDSESIRAKSALLARDFPNAEKHLLLALDHLAATDITELLGPPPSNPQNKIGKNLYIPVEMAGRELASRAWIAGQCSKLGFNVVIGATWNMMYGKWLDFPPGIVLFKTLYAIDARQYHAAKVLGRHRVAVLDEEMMPLALTERIYGFSVEPHALTLADLVCAPGEASAQILRKMAPGKIAVTGNPRAMQRTHHIGGKILVCTSAPMINPPAGFDLNMRMTLRVAGKPLKGEVLEIWRAQIKHEAKWTPVMLEAIDALKQKYGERVVVRPHPAEDPATFGLEKDRETLSHRLSEADCVVFMSSCGIGIEAAMAETPAVRLGNGGDGLSAAFGTGAVSVEDVLAQVETCLAGNQPIPDLTGIIQKEITLPQELEKLWRDNATEDPTDILEGYRQRPRQYHPGQFEMNKFPETTAEQIEEMAGVPAEKIGWNLFVVRAQRLT
jgi:surface carbohydrate biosynthesis protein